MFVFKYETWCPSKYNDNGYTSYHYILTIEYDIDKVIDKLYSTYNNDLFLFIFSLVHNIDIDIECLDEHSIDNIYQMKDYFDNHPSRDTIKTLLNKALLDRKISYESVDISDLPILHSF